LSVIREQNGDLIKVPESNDTLQEVHFFTVRVSNAVVTKAVTVIERKASRFGLAFSYGIEFRIGAEEGT